MKQVLTIAGSDCSGGAGIQADLKTFAAHGVYGMSVIVSVVAENTMRVIGAEAISPESVADQLQAVFEDIDVDAVKIGMLPSTSIMKTVANELQKWNASNIVVDPVMVAKNGFPLMNYQLAQDLIHLVLPHSYIVTPNIPEAQILTGKTIKSIDDMKTAAQIIHSFGPRYVLVKGGHLTDDAIDLLFDGCSFFEYGTKRIKTKNTHGTGCTFSSAIAANLALGKSVKEAIQVAKNYITMAILHSLPLGHGCGPTHHFFEVYENGFGDEA